MKTNVGLLDRLIRFIAAIVLVDLVVGHILTGYWRPIVWILAIVFVTSAMVSICPLYSLLGINTCPHKKTTP